VKVHYPPLKDSMQRWFWIWLLAPRARRLLWK